MAERIAYFGLPEADGGVPFVLLNPSAPEQAVLLLGTMGWPASAGTVEHTVTEWSHAAQLVHTAQHHHNLIPVPFHIGMHFVQKSLVDDVPNGWAELWEPLDEGERNTIQLVDPLRSFPTVIDPTTRIESILDQDRGILFGVAEHVVETVFEDVVTVLESPILQKQEDRRARLLKLIAQAADLALDEETRRRWLSALQVTAWMTREQQWTDLSDACWHTALAMQDGRPGSQIPFVRIWVERQLAHTVETAMTMFGPGGPGRKKGTRGEA